MMDRVPLNLAHFHERRAERFMRHHRYEEAYRAMQTSMLYLQDAYKVVNISKSLEVLNTIKWDFERKIRQINIRKLQHERLRHKEIVPLSEVHSLLLPRQDSQGVVTAKLIARSIDKTIANYDAKLSKSLQEQQQQQTQLSKRTAVNKENLEQQQENCEEAELMQLKQINNKNTNELTNNDKRYNKLRSRALSLTAQQSDETCAAAATHFYDDDDEIPSLAPLDLPTFDYNIFTTSAPSLAHLLSNDTNNK